ncbi:hypothetical protein [Spelaeicoccus albus]|uniref:Lipoprotein n=1 Tax=Spelaeicoccus albus TaxID=1280376 RepID=A0A7Z0A9I4_9MICO|nr:hypothetical protein [Spelaeicoccus albus]NYI66091.1 hypothetical protein [Spelaeicoccus albus]
MKTRKIASGLAVAVVTLTALTGCVTIETGPKPSDTSAPSKSATSTPAPTKDSPKPSATSSPKDAGDDTGKKDADKNDKAKKAKVHALNLDEIKGKRYSRANDFKGVFQPSPVIGPYLESWFVDGNEFRYIHQNCAGQVKRDVSGTIKNGKLVWTGTDDHVDPWIGDLDTHTTPVTITATTLDPDRISVEASTTHIADEKKAFAGYCKKRGKQVGKVFAD